MSSGNADWHMDQRLALHNVQAPRSARILARMLMILLVVTAFALTLTPWQQTIPGAGRVIAFSPEERLQQVEAPVDGRVVKWHVVEGSVRQAWRSDRRPRRQRPRDHGAPARGARADCADRAAGRSAGEVAR